MVPPNLLGWRCSVLRRHLTVEGVGEGLNVHGGKLRPTFYSKRRPRGRPARLNLQPRDKFLLLIYKRPNK
jgi:hypothetical protein